MLLIAILNDPSSGQATSCSCIIRNNISMRAVLAKTVEEKAKKFVKIYCKKMGITSASMDQLLVIKNDKILFNFTAENWAENKHSPEKIVEILHSMERFSVKDGELYTWFKGFKGYDYSESIRSFHDKSFSRKVLEVVEEFLLSNSITPFEVVDRFHCIKKLIFKNGILDVQFEYSDRPMGISEFVLESFTRRILETIEEYLGG